MVDSARDVLDRATKKGLMKGTKRGKKNTKIPPESPSKDVQPLDEIPKLLDNVSISARDEKEPDINTESKERGQKSGKKKDLKPFQF